jgi:Bacterial Ig-like domain (group 1)
MRKFWSNLVPLLLAATLAGCGGASDNPFNPSSGTSTGTGTGTTGTGTGSTTTTVAASELSVNSSTPTIPADGSASATITALAKNDDNNLIAGVNVCFSASSGGIATSSGTNGCVLTAADGSATATLSTAGSSTLRTITVTATAGSQTATTTVQVVAASSSGSTTEQMGNGTGTAFVAGAIGVGVGTAQLPAGGTTGLTVSIVDQNDNLYTAAPVTVTFNSPCVANGLASITATSANGGTVGVATTSTGIVNATYAASGCSGADPITASATIGTQNLAATGTVTVAAAAIGSIQFVSASTTTIGLKGTGLNQTSTLIFKVVNSTGGPYPGVTVTFTPNTTVGGLSISPSTAVSGSDGTVQTTVNAGTVHTAVRVTASITSPAPLSTQSSQLTVTTGLPTSNGFSIAVGKATYLNGQSSLACPNVESWGIDGVTVPITVILSDRYSNPVPDGTAVAFTTDAAQIVGNCNTVGGQCTVTWTSANPRPQSPIATTFDPTPSASPTNPVNPNPPTVPYIFDGRGVILATAIGEESFDDVTGSGFYVAGDSFANLGEPYRDDNENGSYDLGEYFLDFYNKGVYEAPSGTFIGITCTGTTATSTCTQNTLAIGVSHLITMSTSGANITYVSSTPAMGNASGLTLPASGGTVVFNVQDENGNAMAAGTTVSITSGSTTDMTATQVGATAVPCDSAKGGENFAVNLTPNTAGNTTLTVSVASPNGTITYLIVPVTVQ